MPKPRPLTSIEAKKSLANKFAPLADRLRQLNTKFGIRPYRVFLVWTQWTGKDRGEGDESEYKRVEILPTPKVVSLDSLTNAITVSGTLPTGTIRVTEVSAQMTFDDLSGYLFPNEKEKIPHPYSFFYEVVGDGRQNAKEQRRKFRLYAPPALDADNIGWILVLEREAEDRDRDAQSQAGLDQD